MKIERLSRNNIEEVVKVLASAFRDYPVMRFALKDAGAQYGERLNAIMEFYTEARLSKDRPVLGIRDGDSLVAVALVDETSLKPWAEMESALKSLKQTIGDGAYDRLELYERVSSKSEPAEPHHFLGMIAVLPSHQGKGYSRALLDEVKKMSVADPDSSGVCLSTEDLQNVLLYKHFGYKVIAEIDIAELHSWCMFLPTKSDRGINRRAAEGAE